MQNRSRRIFLKKAALGSAAAIGIPQIVSAAMNNGSVKKIPLKQNDIILFQGDSIPDSSRKRDDSEPNSPSALGRGYPYIAASELLLKHPGKNLRIYNKGISGNKVFQLAERWDDDCLSLKPNVLSILIGVNDFWHTLVNNYAGTVKTYKDDLTTLLDKTKQQLPDVQLVLGEPFAVNGIRSVDDKWFPAFRGYQDAARETASRYNALFIPYQKVFDEAQKRAPGVYWTYDGVHPSLAGASLMAQAWMEVIE